MEIKQFKSLVARIVEPELSALGYDMDINPPGQDGEEGLIWFEKKPQEGIYVVVEFQPRALQPNYLIEFAINLNRNYYSDKIPRDQMRSGYILHGRLATWLWIEDRLNPEWESDHWWHFRDEDELEDACRDALDKLLKYGIPWVEDLSSRPLR